MMLEDAHAQVAGVHDAVVQQFGANPLHESRLHQFSAACKTMLMSLGHLYDEDIRHGADPKAHLKAIGAYVPEA